MIHFLFRNACENDGDDSHLPVKITPHFLFGSGGVAASFRAEVCSVVLMRAGWQAGASLAVGHVHAGGSAGVGDVTARRCDQSNSAGHLAATPAVPWDSATVHLERGGPAICALHSAHCASDLNTAPAPAQR